MPLPKRRHSRERGRKRRTHYKLSAPGFGECPKCHAPKLSHYACPECGMYGDRLVVEKKQKTAASGS